MAKKGKKSEKKHSNRTNVNDDQSVLSGVTPRNIGVLDMVIAFGTTGSTASYIGAVRKEVSDLVPRLFRYNKDLKLGIVAFGDYCDMNNATDFGNHDL